MVMKQTTPYRVRPVGEQAREAACVSKILEQAVPVKVIYEAFGGIGTIGQLLTERFPDTFILSYELDEECVNLYRERRLSNVQVCCCDTREFFESLPIEDLAASLDFNLFTLLDLTRPAGAFQREILNGVFARNPKWVHLTDSSCSKLHLNWKSYGLTDSAWSFYVEKLDAEFRLRWGYRVVTVEKHARAAYFLLKSEMEN